MSAERIWWWSCQAYKSRLVFLARLLKTINFVLFKAILPYQADIQRDIRLEHYGLGVVIHPNVRIGHRVRIFHQVTIAAQVAIGAEEQVVIGDDVLIGAGAIIISGVNQGLCIGNGAKVGAGAVVTEDVAVGMTVVSVHARYIMPRQM